MPRYHYVCATCGAFEAMQPMAAFADPCACPGCGAAAPRDVAAPRLRNGEAARTSPAVGSSHRVGCGCCRLPGRAGLRADTVAAGTTKPGSASSGPATSFLAGG